MDRSILAMVREAILSPNAQAIQELNDVFEDNDVPRIKEQSIWLLQPDDAYPETYPVGFFYAIEDIEEAFKAMYTRHLIKIMKTSFVINMNETDIHMGEGVRFTLLFNHRDEEAEDYPLIFTALRYKLNTLKKHNGN